MSNFSSFSLPEVKNRGRGAKSAAKTPTATECPGLREKSDDLASITRDQISQQQVSGD